jgi:hypothetical protein
LTVTLAARAGTADRTLAKIASSIVLESLFIVIPMGSIIDRRSYAHQLEAGLWIRASTVGDWVFDFVLGQGAEARRLRALPVWLKEPERLSDTT